MKKAAFLSLALATALATVSVAPAEARPGSGSSMGSRGSRTYSAPPPTAYAPSGASPMQRSVTPYQQAPAQSYGYGQPGYGRMGYANRHPFLTGFAGGFLGAGLFGLLGGHGFFGGMHGGGFFGFLIQMLLLGLLISWLIRRFGHRSPMSTGIGNQPRMPQSGGMNPGGAPLTITPADYQAFQQSLYDIQAAWSQQNLGALQRMATPEMVSYFNEQLSAYASRGARNVVSAVQFEGGDLSEAWREGNLDYATVAMRYSLVDVTTDMAGTVVEGNPNERMTVTELWTFVRSGPHGGWLLSAIQQTR
ncbi:mitochondrial import inner membrane translocase subunit Tim44 [Ameyamaea chiangmaiensis NBRC 103196]|uniref:Tim44 domain-containing protein n=1 Tax=Ameyamaea chiangmaiensis TaxID=442969 RepID=A0A850PBV5_9PROT|nr:Tim44-like domain-containing protein [Ameyamaea chiangmaiensis]MBS4073888.1 Tim44 domain-containing protein [Ameyamaea chiangmaiensis]NVN41428.1 Tim44 domain-containing protein [Ameyamaea chiangmaiensis]GBQ68052.1 mitochondrial import inner membrane translocase subunit Tim44 [Ameyamaea chiangmaiensis NBRC 103196]